MLGHVHHIGYRVGDLDSAITEYNNLFGSEVVYRFKMPDGSPAAFLTIGPIQVELIQKSGSQGQQLDHVAYIADDLDKEMEALKEKEAEFATSAPLASPNGDRFIFVNVLGSRIQLYQPAKKV